MNYLKKNTQNSHPEVIIDTNTFFSALYNPEGNEAYLLELADKGKCSIQILDYVLDELKAVFNRKEIDFKLVTDLLHTYDNIYICELGELSSKEMELAKKNVSDSNDRPIFVFVYRRIKDDDDVYFVSGDQGFFEDEIFELLDEKVFTTREILKKITSE